MTNIKSGVSMSLSKIDIASHKLIYEPKGFKPFMVIQRHIVNRLDGIRTYKHRLTHGKYTIKYLG